MNKIILTACLLFSSITFANPSLPEGMPSIDINGVAHYIADFDEHRNIWLDSAEGFCVLKGYSYASMVSSYVANVGPIVILDARGNVVSTQADNAAGQYSIASSITCQ